VARQPREKSAGPAALLVEIDKALGAGDWKAALRLADKGVRRDPDDAELRHARGVALRRLGRHDAALEAFGDAIDLDGSFPEPYLDSAELLLDEMGDDVRALEILRAAERQIADDLVRAEIALLRGVAMAHLDDFTGALRALDVAAKLDAENPDVPTERGSVQLELLGLEDAEKSLREALELSSENARAHQLLAFVLDYTGRRAEAARHFELASRTDPQAPARPPRLSEREFDEAVAKALGTIPARFARHLENVEISVENYADREFCRHHDCGPMTLGVYVGTPLTLRTEGAERLPDRIILFQRSIENVCHDTEEVVREIAITLKHEIGHFLGFDEHELAERGYE
jgi:predicted Zn-dependent protease with MMP-like domain/Flp pilus assembly protein TadD